jgi:hypothetical protein
MMVARILGSMLVLAWMGCGSNDEPKGGNSVETAGNAGGVSGPSAGSAAQMSTPTGTAGRSAGSSAPQLVSGMSALPSGGMTASSPAGTGGAGRSVPSGSAGSSMAGAGTSGIGGGAGTPSMQPPATGPKDGDPSKPVVAIDGIPCGPSMAAFGGGNYEIGGRKLIVDYPCNKHEGAQVTVILNLHGTLIMGAPFSYQHAYFSAHRFVDSHNLIVLTPQSVSTASSGAQWGNMDNGADIPHLLAVVDWAYTAFAKFQIRGLWVGGHSWGAAFVTAAAGGGPFACNPMLGDKVKGAIGMSRLSMPSCASRLSLIATRGEMENIALLDQNNVAMGHGCMTPMKGPEAVGNNEYRYFAACSPGWAHEDYMMTGKGHIDNMDQEVVKKIVDAIKATEQ